MNLITKDEFHNMFINCFSAVSANDLVNTQLKIHMQQQMCLMCLY